MSFEVKSLYCQAQVQLTIWNAIELSLPLFSTTPMTVNLGYCVAITKPKEIIFLLFITYFTDQCQSFIGYGLLLIHICHCTEKWWLNNPGR